MVRFTHPTERNVTCPITGVVRPGGTYFFTVVTYHRHPFPEPCGASSPGELNEGREKGDAVQTVAIALLSDHLHCIWTLPPGDAEYSERWKQIKTGFTMRWLEIGGIGCL